MISPVFEEAGRTMSCNLVVEMTSNFDTVPDHARLFWRNVNRVLAPRIAREFREVALYLMGHPDS